MRLYVTLLSFRCCPSNNGIQGVRKIGLSCVRSYKKTVILYADTNAKTFYMYKLYTQIFLEY